MAERLQKILKFSKNNKDVYDILCDQGNYSLYVCDAVRYYREHFNYLEKPLINDYEDDKTSLYEIKKHLERIEDLINSSPKGPVIRTSPLVDSKLLKQILDEDD